MPYTPWTSRKFGVEIETREVRTDGTGFSLRDLSRVLEQACTMPVRNAGGYAHSDGSRWEVKTDASCGYEVAAPALVMNAQRHCDELRRGCNAIASLTPRIDRTCGLHVHVDCSDFTWEEIQTLTSLWCRYEPFFFSLVPPTRRTNRYCKAMRKHQHDAPDASSWVNVRAMLAATTRAAMSQSVLFSPGEQRYHCLNINGWFRHGRVEFRLHSGTCDYDKIRNWVCLVVALVHRVKQTSMPSVGRIVQSAATNFPTPYVCKVLGLIATPECPDVPAENADLVAWIEMRRAQFDPANRPAPAPSVGPRVAANI